MLRFSSSMILAIAVTVLVGCGARVTMTSATGAEKGKTELIVVEARSSVATNDLSYSDAANAAAQLQDLVVAELNKRGIAAVSVSSTEGQRGFGGERTALLALSIARAERGNATKRLIIGFGYGKSQLEVDAKLLAPTLAEQKVIAGFRTNAGSGYKPGIVMPLGIGAATGGYVLASAGVNLATGLTKTPDRDLQSTAKAIAKTVAQQLR